MSRMSQLLSGWTVMVVDDEEDSLDVARRLLLKSGANVVTANNGRDALQLVHEHKPDCILSDLSMPEMDGWLLMSELNQNRSTSEIPVIALTAHAMPGDRARAIEAGFINYITKPLDARKFIQQLVAILVDIPNFNGRFAVTDLAELNASSIPSAHKPNAGAIASAANDPTKGLNHDSTPNPDC